MRPVKVDAIFQNLMWHRPDVVKLPASSLENVTLADGEKVEVIGGADKYMAVCRDCYHSNVRVAASPRCPLKTKIVNNGDEENVSPVKKMLFSNGSENSSTSGAV